MTRSVFRICQTKYPKPHSMDRAADRSQRLAILEYTRKYDFRIDDRGASAASTS